MALSLFARAFLARVEAKLGFSIRDSFVAVFWLAALPGVDISAQRCGSSPRHMETSAASTKAVPCAGGSPLLPVGTHWVLGWLSRRRKK